MNLLPIIRPERESTLKAPGFSRGLAYPRHIDYAQSVSKRVVTMSMGAYDEDEHERREQKTSSVDASFDDERTNYNGDLEYESGDSTEELLDQFERINSR